MTDGTCCLQAVPGIKLYQFVKAGSSGSWQLVSSHAQPQYYDANEDSRSAKPDYFLEVGDVDTRVDEKLRHVAERSTKRVTFAANGSLWALRFPNDDTYNTFMDQLQVSSCSTQV